MSFARPELLWGLLALALPVLLSLLGRGKPEALPFPGFSLLQESVAEASRFSRRRGLWELLTRLLLLATLVLVLAGPRFDAAQGASGSLARDLVIIMDDSASMARPYRGGPATRLERAGGLARGLIERLAPGRQAALVRLSDPEAGLAGDGARIDRLLVDMLPRPVNDDHALITALAAARRCFPLRDPDDGLGAPALLVVTDGGARVFGGAPPEDMERHDLTLALLADAEEPAPAIRFTDQAPEIRGQGAEGTRVLTTQDLDIAQLTLTHHGPGTAVLESGLPTGQAGAASALLRVSFSALGRLHGWVSPANHADALARAPWAASLGPPRRVAIGAPSPGDPAPQLLHALLTGGESGLGARFQSETLDFAAKLSALATFHVAILTRGFTDSTPVERLRSLVADGLTLVVMPDPRRPAESLRALSTLAPVEIGDAITGLWAPASFDTASDGWGGRSGEAARDGSPRAPPPSRDAKPERTGSEVVRDIEKSSRVYQAVRLSFLGNESAGGRALLGLVPLGDDGRTTTTTQQPLVLECPIDAGRILIFAASPLSMPGEPIAADLDPYWWVPMLHRILDQGRPEERFPRRVVWGQSLALDAGWPGAPNRYRLVRLGAETHDEEPPALDEQRPVLRFTRWSQLGAYQIFVARGESVRDLGVLEVTLPGDEQFERPCAAQILAKWEVPTVKVPELDELTLALQGDEAQIPTHSAWWIMLVALFVLETVIHARR